MAIILPFKSQFTSLIITAVSAVCECAFLYAFANFNGLLECRKLKQGRKVLLRGHFVRSTIITVGSFTLFILLEVLASFLSDPILLNRVENHSCVSVGNVLNRKNDSLKFPVADDILLNCLRKKTFFLQYGGNYSKQNKTIQCSDQPMYSYRTGDITSMNVSGATMGCVDSDEGNACVFAAQKGNVTFISDMFLEIDRPNIEQLDAFETVLNFEAKGMLKVWAKRTVESRLKDFHSPAQLRRLVFSGAEDTNCNFDIPDGDGTSIELALVCFLVAIWGLSLFLFSLSLLIRGKIFYNMSKPMHWATKTLRTIDDDGSDDVQVSSAVEDGEVGVFLTSSKYNTE